MAHRSTANSCSFIRLRARNFRELAGACREPPGGFQPALEAAERRKALWHPEFEVAGAGSHLTNRHMLPMFRELVNPLELFLRHLPAQLPEPGKRQRRSCGLAPEAEDFRRFRGLHYSCFPTLETSDEAIG